MQITFTRESLQEIDGIDKVFTQGLVGSTVDVTRKDGTSFRADVSEAGWSDKEEAFGVTFTDHEAVDGPVTFVAFGDLQEVKYL